MDGWMNWGVKWNEVCFEEKGVLFKWVFGEVREG